MLRNNLLRRISIATLFLLVATILYKYPSNIKTTSYLEKPGSNIFLLDSNGYVSLTKSNCIIKDDDIKNIIEIYTNNYCIPDGFYSYLDNNIKVIDYSIDNGLLKINFNEYFYKMKNGFEEKIIEMLVYSFTSLNNIDKVMFFVEGNILDRIPNINKRINTVLDRSFGINKVIDITTFSNVSNYNVYYLGKCNDSYYYIPVTYVVNDSDVARLIITKLKGNNINSSLLTHLNMNVELVDYNIENDKMDVTFNSNLNELFIDGELKEEVKYSLEASFLDSFDVKSVEINISS